MKNCGICDKELSGRFKSICLECGIKKYEIICDICGEKQYSSAYYFLKTKGHSNCKKCVCIGDKNSSYGKKWSDEKKHTQSLLIKSKVDDEYRSKCASGMLGKTVSQETKDKKRATEQKKYETGFKRSFSEEGRKNIGEASSKRFTPAYKVRIRKIHEDKGTWIRYEDKNDYIFYRELANWSNQPITIFTPGVELLKENKLYSETHDKYGIVRDHMYSRKQGFDDGVFPEIVKHPANCQLITHVENIRKSKKNNDCIMNRETLFANIKSWQLEYDMQNKCLELIYKYESGERYVKENYTNYDKT